MATSYFRIGIRAEPHLDKCFEMAPGPMKNCINALIYQSSQAMCTEPALAALVSQAQRWAKVHKPWTHLERLTGYARDFQTFLRPNALLDNANKAMFLIDMSMGDDVLGVNSSPWNFHTFNASEARIALNGKVGKIYRSQQY